MLLSGSVGLSMRLPADHRLVSKRDSNPNPNPHPHPNPHPNQVSKRGTVVQCGVCEAGGGVGHTSIFGASTPAHEALDATTTADTLTLCLDRASARSLLPEDVVAALRRRRDEAYLYPPCTHHAATIYPPCTHHLPTSLPTTYYPTRRDEAYLWGAASQLGAAELH